MNKGRKMNQYKINETYNKTRGSWKFFFGAGRIKVKRQTIPRAIDEKFPGKTG